MSTTFFMGTNPKIILFFSNQSLFSIPGIHVLQSSEYLNLKREHFSEISHFIPENFRGIRIGHH